MVDVRDEVVGHRISAVVVHRRPELEDFIPQHLEVAALGALMQVFGVLARAHEDNLVVLEILRDGLDALFLAAGGIGARGLDERRAGLTPPLEGASDSLLDGSLRHAQLLVGDAGHALALLAFGLKHLRQFVAPLAHSPPAPAYIRDVDLPLGTLVLAD